MPNTSDLKVHLDQRYAAEELFALQSRALHGFEPPPTELAGRGIVTAIYDRVIAAGWVLLCELARLRVILPIEVWHRPGELSEAHRAALLGLPLDLTLRELADDVVGFAVKPVILWRTCLCEVLWLDADNTPLRDPSFLFEDPEYVAKGSLFWRDTSGTERARTWHPAAPVWSVFGVKPNTSEEFETGQMLVNKARRWPEICLTAYYAFNHRFFYHFVLGDKDTFRLAWQRVARERGDTQPQFWYHADPSLVPYGMMPYGPYHLGLPNRWGAWGGGSVLQQRDRAGQALFNHRNTEKFSLDRPNPFNTDVPNEARYHAHVAALARLLDLAVPEPLRVARPFSLPLAKRPELPCAWGDAFDRLTILRIKAACVTDPEKHANVIRELAAVEDVIGPFECFPPELDALVSELAAVNVALWKIEDATRASERSGRFGADFVALARSVYRENDRRAAIKNQISRLLGSALIEEKQHAVDD